MFKITFLLFVALVRGQTPLPGQTVENAYTIVETEPPYGFRCDAVDWALANDDDGEPGEGTHAEPYFAALNSDSAADPELSTRCGEKFALFKTEDADFEQDPIYIIIAASKDKDADELEIGPNACASIDECTATFGVALKLPEISILSSNVPRSDVMCTGYDFNDSGDGAPASPYYVYVHTSSTKKLFADHDHCGRLYQFGENQKYVVVAGTTSAGASGDGLELVIREEDCDNLADCDLEGYAIWTGLTISLPENSTTEETDSPSPSETSTTESTTSSRLPLDTTTEEDSTFFAAVGLTLFALLA